MSKLGKKNMLRNKTKKGEETRFAFPNVTSNAIIHVPFYELYYTEYEREEKRRNKTENIVKMAT